MTRRQSVIATLAAVVGALLPQRSNAQEATPTTDINATTSTNTFKIAAVEIQHHTSVQLLLVDESDKDSYGIPNIVVSYHGRTLNLTSKEIMEALESR